MNKYYDIHYSDPHPTPKKRKNPWWMVLKVFSITFASLIIIAGIAVWIIAYHISPEKISKIIEKEATEYLDADIGIGKLDYKLFKTYPWLEFEIDSLYVISKSLHSLSREELKFLPPNPEKLVSIEKLSGKINVHSLLKNKINIKDISIVKPDINIVIYNDSIANYNILRKELPHISRLPEFKISEISIEAPMLLQFFSLPLMSEAYVNVQSFYLADMADKDYEVGFEGDIRGHYGDFSIPGSLPVKFKSIFSPNFPDPALNLKNLEFSLAGISITAEGDMNISNNIAELKTFQLKLKVDDIFKLYSLLPQQFAEQIKIPDGISGSLPLQLDLNLASQWIIPLSNLNTADLDVPALYGVTIIPEGHLNLAPKGFKPVEADNLFVKALFSFNPHDFNDNKADISFRMNGEGLNVDGSMGLIPLDSITQQVKGSLTTSSNINETLAYLLPKPAMKVLGHLACSTDFCLKTLNFGKDGLKDISVKGDFHSKSLKINGVGESAKIKNVKTDFQARVPSYPLKDYRDLDILLSLRADSILTSSSASSYMITGFKVNIEAMDTVSGSPRPDGDIHISAETLNLTKNKTRVYAKGLDIVANGAMNSPNSSGPNFTTVSPTSGYDDALIAALVNHTPLVVEYDGGGIISTIMGLLSLDAEMKVSDLSLVSPDYLYPFDIRGLDVATNLNRLNFFASDVKIGDSGFSTRGEVNGLLPFLTSYSATPISVDADLNFSNVDINHLAWGYYGALIESGLNPDSIFFTPPILPYSAADSICVAIPRNINANVRLSANSAEYTQYRFSPLSTDIIVKEGSATLSRLTVGAPYAKAIVDWTYSTSRLDNIFMDLKAKVENFSFEPFYKVFPSLLEKAPELSNLSGNINADVSCRFLMFPDMFMDAQSLQGAFHIRGNNLQFARSGKIEKITHLMLIEGDHPIHLHNLDITGAFHDNLLQVNPFKISFDDYQLGFAGVNNTSGQMYYHLALEKSPFHLPFGVSVFGNFKHPEIRLGGTHIDDYRSELVADNEANHIDANIMTYLRHGWLLFIQEAAKYARKEDAPEK